MNDFLGKRPLGGSGLLSSRLGIGSTFDPPAAVIESAFERGVNYLYWGTVRRPAFAVAMRNIARRHRDAVILTVQSYSRNAAAIEPDVEEAVRSAGIDGFDFLLLGSRSEEPAAAFIEVFERLRARGLVRFLSLSSHNRPLLPSLLDAYRQGRSPYELLMLRYNAAHRGAERDVFPHVGAAPRPAIVAYTATRWGHLLDPARMPPGEAPLRARDCYRFALSHAAVDLVLCGPANAAQMDEAISALDAGPLSAAERERIERIGAHVYAHHAAKYPDGGDVDDIVSGRVSH